MPKGDKTPRFRNEEYWKNYRKNWHRQRRFKSRSPNVGKWLKKSRFMDGFWEVAGRFFHVRSQLQDIGKWGNTWTEKDSESLPKSGGWDKDMNGISRSISDKNKLRLARIQEKINAIEKNRVRG